MQVMLVQPCGFCCLSLACRHALPEMHITLLGGWAWGGGGGGRRGSLPQCFLPSILSSSPFNYPPPPTSNFSILPVYSPAPGSAWQMSPHASAPVPVPFTHVKMSANREVRQHSVICRHRTTDPMALHQNAIQSHIWQSAHQPSMDVCAPGMFSPYLCPTLAALKAFQAAVGVIHLNAT